MKLVAMEVLAGDMAVVALEDAVACAVHMWGSLYGCL